MSKAATRSSFGFVVIAVLLVALAGVTGRGPLRALQRSSNSSDTATNAKPARAPTAHNNATSSTIQALEMRSYRRGDCVNWDQRHSTARRSTNVIPCEQTHLVEIAGEIDVSGRFDHYPSEPEWTRVFSHDCLASVRSLLGGPLDPDGRFTTGGIEPLADAWGQGVRTAWCGVVATRTGPAVHRDTFESFRGKVEGASQVRTEPVGTCLGSKQFAVACATPHSVEIVGYVDLTGLTTQPPAVNDNAGWDRLVGDKCGTVGRAYLGHPLSGDEGFGWLSILPASWAAGRRVVECTVARYDKNGKTIPMSTSLKG
jgi:hypothetical protein